MTTWIYVLLMLVLLCGSAFFSASEMALSSANRMRLASAAEEGNRAAGIACKVIDKYENALSAAACAVKAVAQNGLDRDGARHCAAGRKI